MSRFLKVINDFPGGTNTLYAEELGINVRTVRRYIDQFKEWGLIRRNGTNRKGYWEIIKSETEVNPESENQP
ncbi:MAG: HTH domain-containing protein [Muribaculaceae bacterium]|nr:HTH domain-containing protein [Muribaculaceae bacterium]